MPANIAKVKSYLKQAQSPQLPVVTRLYAIGLLAQTLDRLFTETTAIPRGENGQPQQTLFQSQSLKSPNSITPLFQQATQLLHGRLLPELCRSHHGFSTIEQLSDAQYNWLLRYFHSHIYPLLTPSAVDSTRPFPTIRSDSLYLLVILQKRIVNNVTPSPPLYVCVQVPTNRARWLEVPALITLTTKGYCSQQHTWVWLEEVVRHFVHTLFSGLLIQNIYQFRLLRASFLQPNGQVAEVASRLDVEDTMPAEIITWLRQYVAVPTDAVIPCTPPLALHHLLTWLEHQKDKPLFWQQQTASPQFVLRPR